MFSYVTADLYWLGVGFMLVRCLLMLADVDRYWTGDGNCAQSSAAGLLDYYGFKTEAQQFYNASYPYGGGF